MIQYDHKSNTTLLQSIIEMLWLRLGVREAIEYPRFHHQLLPATLRVEDDMPQVTKVPCGSITLVSQCITNVSVEQ